MKSLPRPRINFSEYESDCGRFIDLESYPETEELRKELLRSFDVPDILTTKTCTILNGYFGSRSHYTGEGKVESHSTLFWTVPDS